MPTIGRREILVGGASVAMLGALATLSRHRRAVAQAPEFALVPDPDGILDLPPGFRYEIVERSGQPMSDGYRVPGRPDGMACFAGPDGTLVLMRNHENHADPEAEGPYHRGQEPPAEAYDREGMGGVTRVVLDGRTHARISSNLVLAGTVRNCGGGPSPWGWLSCEENTEIRGELRHGYAFVCPIDAETVRPAQPVVGYGRFNHEAIAIDPSNHYAYLTEDRQDSCLYRFVPDAFTTPFAGRLQALKVVGQSGYDPTAMAVGAVLEVEWIDVAEPDPDSDTVRVEAHANGAAVIVRGEGIWFFEGQVYVCSTAGGPIGKGQIFRLIDGERPTLELVVVATDASVLDNPDNITVAPWGEVFMAEDGEGDQYIRWLTADGAVRDFARNSVSGSELAGVCFAPDGSSMFVNLQADGLTLRISGPFLATPNRLVLRA